VYAISTELRPERTMRRQIMEYKIHHVIRNGPHELFVSPLLNSLELSEA
jgi:hypothetical protein